MKKKQSLSSILKKLEKIEENQQGQLDGGFISINMTFASNETGGVNEKRCVNNCLGGNCISGCSSNAVIGCGT